MVQSLPPSVSSPVLSEELIYHTQAPVTTVFSPSIVVKLKPNQAWADRTSQNTSSHVCLCCTFCHSE